MWFGTFPKSSMFAFIYSDQIARTWYNKLRWMQLCFCLINWYALKQGRNIYTGGLTHTSWFLKSWNWHQCMVPCPMISSSKWCNSSFKEQKCRLFCLWGCSDVIELMALNLRSIKIWVLFNDVLFFFSATTNQYTFCMFFFIKGCFKIEVY